MKKIVLLITLLTLTFLSVGCKKEQNTLSDALKFKEEYEELNGQKNTNNVDFREVNIPENNPFIYASADDIVKKIDNGDTFAVYFGFNSCPWCRSILSTLIDVANDLNIKNIYYVDVSEIRNTYEFNSENELIESKKGSNGYLNLLDRLDSILSEYTLTNSKGKTINVGQKRIYAPNIVSVVNGNPEKLEDGISSLQTDGYMKLTEEMQQESYDEIKCVLDCLAKDTVECHIGC